MIQATERYDPRVVRSLQALGRDGLAAQLATEREQLAASWTARERFGPCPRPATRPTRHQLRLLAQVELLESVLCALEPPRPAQERTIAPCEVLYEDEPRPGKVIAICRGTGVMVESWGQGDPSRRRSLALLRDECGCGGWHEEGPELDEELEDDEEEPEAAAVLGDHADVPGVREPGAPDVDPGEVPVVRLQGDVVERGVDGAHAGA